MPIAKAEPKTKRPPVKQAAPVRREGGNPVLLLCGVILFTFFIYSNSITNGFTNWDDPSHVTSNEDIKSLSPQSIGNMFKPVDKYMYHPLTILSYAVNYSFSKLKPGGYHFTNILFHLF